MPTTSRGAPYPAGSSGNNVPADLQALAGWVNDRPGVSTLTAAQRNALAGGDLWAGRLIWNSSVGRLERYTGNGWVPVLPGETGAWRTFGNQVQWTNQTSFAVLPHPVERAALTTTLIKSSSDTVLVVDVAGSLQLNSGVAQLLYLGLRINGVDYDVARRHTQRDAVVRVDFGATRRIPNVAAGDLTIEPVFASANASLVYGFAGDDQISYNVREATA